MHLMHSVFKGGWLNIVGSFFNRVSYKMTDKGYVKGQSDNLPSIDSFIVASFMQSAERFSLGEVRGVKAESMYFIFIYFILSAYIT